MVIGSLMLDMGVSQHNQTGTWSPDSLAFLITGILIVVLNVILPIVCFWYMGRMSQNTRVEQKTESQV